MDAVIFKIKSVVRTGVVIVSVAALLSASVMCSAEEQGVPAAEPAPAETSGGGEAPAAQPSSGDVPGGGAPAAQPSSGDASGGEAPAAQPPAADITEIGGESSGNPAEPAGSGSVSSDAAGSGNAAESATSGADAGTGSETGAGEVQADAMKEPEGTAEEDSASEAGDKKEGAKKQQAAVWYFYGRGYSGSGVVSDPNASGRKLRKVQLTDEIRKCVDGLDTLHAQKDSGADTVGDKKEAAFKLIYEFIKSASDKKMAEGSENAPDGEKEQNAVEMIGEWKLPLCEERALEHLLEKTEKSGHHLGLVMIDIGTGQGVAVNAGRKFYGASSIKGPFIISLATMYPQTVERQKNAFRNIAVNSDNGSYISLVHLYGRRYYDAWSEAVGAEAPLTAGDFADLSAEDLTRMWLLCYQFITGNRRHGELMGALFETPNRSAIQPVLGKAYKTQTKGGWIAERVSASADAGIVYAGKHPYVLALVSDYPSDLRKLEPYVALMNRIHMELTGDRLARKRSREFVRE